MPELIPLSVTVPPPVSVAPPLATTRFDAAVISIEPVLLTTPGPILTCCPQPVDVNASNADAKQRNLKILITSNLVVYLLKGNLYAAKNINMIGVFRRSSRNELLMMRCNKKNATSTDEKNGPSGLIEGIDLVLHSRNRLRF